MFTNHVANEWPVDASSFKFSIRPRAARIRNYATLAPPWFRSLGHNDHSLCVAHREQQEAQREEEPAREEKVVSASHVSAPPSPAQRQKSNGNCAERRDKRNLSRRSNADRLPSTRNASQERAPSERSARVSPALAMNGYTFTFLRRRKGRASRFALRQRQPVCRSSSRA